jgi:hypothetical protein
MTVPIDKDRRIRLLEAALRNTVSALELAQGWIDAKREDENTGEGRQAKFILDSIDGTIKNTKSIL